MPEATLGEIKKFFEYSSIREFGDDWKKLSPEDGKQLREGIGNGSLTY